MRRKAELVARPLCLPASGSSVVRQFTPPHGGSGAGAAAVPLHREDDMRVDLRDDGLRDMEELREAVARDVLREGACSQPEL